MFQNKTFSEFQTIENFKKGFRITYVLPLTVTPPFQSKIGKDLVAYSLTVEYKPKKKVVNPKGIAASGYILNLPFTSTVKEALKKFCNIPFAGNLASLNSLFEKDGLASGFDIREITSGNEVSSLNEEQKGQIHLCLIIFVWLIVLI